MFLLTKQMQNIQLHYAISRKRASFNFKDLHWGIDNPSLIKRWR